MIDDSAVATTSRTRRLVSSAILMVFALVVSVVVISALRAEGRSVSRADTNDGGAWLVKRDLGYVGHVNRVVAEVTKAVNVSAPGAVLDVDQARGVLVAYDASGNQISVIDDASGAVINELATPDGAVVRAVDGGAVIFTPDELTLWLVDHEMLASATSLDGIDPAMSGAGRGAARVRGDTVVAVDSERIYRMGADGEMEAGPEHGMTDPVADLTFVGSTVVLAGAGGDGVVVDGDRVRPIDLGNGLGTDGDDADGTNVGDGGAPALAQPVEGGDSVELVTPGGVLHRVGLADGATPQPIADLDGRTPLPPITHGGCTFTVVQEPATFQKVCGGETHERMALAGAGPELRLKLVNGWVWINDLDTGAAWMTDPERPLARITDWDSVLNPRDEVDDQLIQDEGGEEVFEENPDSDDADVHSADDLDIQDENRPPVAEDDVAGTRADRELLVDVLENDWDPDGDVLRVVGTDLGASDQEDGHRTIPTPDGAAVLFSPAPGFTGTVSFTYEIDDGRGGSDTANVDVTVLGRTENNPPETTMTIVSTRPGQPASVNVLQNDTDPEGDALYLYDIWVDTELAHPGELIWDQSGRVTYTPDSDVEASRIELGYEVRDEYGASATGVLRVLVRLEDTNSPPDARHDRATTVVGRTVNLDVLENDYDPDGDPLIAQGLNLIQPRGVELSTLDTNLRSDGEFTFRPDDAGTFVFSYAASDGEEHDTALIRVDVAEPDENRPPVAVRDDVVIPRGGSRMVYVLDNDSDPDGDVVGLVRNSETAGLRIQEVGGFAYLVHVDADAPSQVEFTYTISDGFEEDTAPVVVTVAEDGDADQPPVALDDEIDVRPGGSAMVPVLENDFDPKGGSLVVVDATDNPDAGILASPSADRDMVEVSVDPGVTSGGEVTYDIADEAGNTAAARIEVRIVPPDQENRPPIARPDVARTTSGQAVLIPVLANDSDPDGDAITLDTIAEQPANGTAERAGDGMIEYRPSDSFTGTDRFTYTIVDEFGARATGEVLVGVMPPVDNRPPQARDDEFEVVAGSDAASLDVLANDTDPDGDELTVVDVTDPQLGDVTIPERGGHVTYTPPVSVDEPTETSFTYEISDGAGGRDRANVLVMVVDEAEPQPPVAQNITTDQVAPGGEVTVDVLSHVSDPDTPVEQLEVSVTDDTLEVTDDGEVVIVAGDESSRHRYVVTDPDGLSDEAHITVMVVDNQPPVFEPMEFETAEGEPVTMRLHQFVSDPDGDPLFFGCCDNRRGGGTDVEKGEDRLLVTFTPNDGFTGQGGFTITADDQMGRPVSGRVVVNVTASNRPPQAGDTTAQVPAAGSTTVELNQLASDPDPGDVLGFDIGRPVSGNVGASLQGSQVTITAPAGAVDSTDRIDYTATDRDGESASGTINVNVVAPEQPPPQAVADSAEVHQGQSVTIPVLANDNDPIGDGLRIVGVGGTDGGSATAQGDGIVFAAHGDFSGTTNFTYTIADAADREASAQVTVDVIGRPSAPPRPNAQAGAGQATVTWQTPSGNGAQITGYQIRLNGGEVRDVGAGNSETLGGLTNGQTYTFEVRGINVAGEGDWSPPSNEVMPDVRPGRPGAPQVEFRDSALHVTWGEPPNEGSPIQGYDLRISGATNETRQLGNRTSYLWEGLRNGESYTFSVRARNLHPDPSEWSADSAPERPSREPDAPNPPAVQRGDGSLDVCWNAPYNGGDVIAEYRLEMQSNGQTTSVGSSTCYTWHNLPQGQPQQFRVQARNRAGWSPWSGWSNAVKPCGTPDAPGAPSAARGDQQATITWQAPNDQGCPITQYEIQDQNGNEYRFRIRAINEEGAGGWSQYSNNVVPAGPPCTPSNVRATPGVGQVTVSWDRPCDNGSSIHNYVLYVNDSARNVGNVTSYTVTGLSNSTTYRFRVAAQNDVGVGDRSSEASATTHGEPSQVRNLSASASDRTITVSWSTPSSNGGTSITGYRIEGAPGGTTTVTSSPRTFTGEYGRTYNITVRACNAVGCGAGSSTSVTVRDPQQVRISKGGNAQGMPGCSTSHCRFVRADVTGFSANTTYSTRCWSEQRGNWGNGGGITTNGSGNWSGDLSCYFGYPGDRVYVEVGGHRSNTITW